jgi:hypothetical protein
MNIDIEIMMQNEIIKEFLNAYWLRPETAIWRTMDSNFLKGTKFESPMLDLGCGDRIFSFVNFGGKTDIDFDVYKTTNIKKKFLKGDDNQSYITPKIIKKIKLMWG